LGLADEIGSLEVGKRPGIVLIEGIEEHNGELQLSPSATTRRLI
jgi:cytosine/adenosine deaminase-related metal-dependent hydrolase